jgi:hypothetical protein
MATLTVTDNLDGTGGIATISGSSSGSAAHTLYRAELNNKYNLQWAEVGTRTGNGTIAVGGPTRLLYLWYVKSVDGGNETVSAPILQGLTNAAYEAVRYRCMQAVEATIKLLDLDAIGDKVFLRFREDDVQHSLPGCCIFPDITPDLEGRGTNQEDDVGMGVQVVLKDVSMATSDEAGGRHFLWEERLKTAFRNQRLEGVPESLYCTIEPLKTLDPKSPIYSLVDSSCTIRCWVRVRRRGLSA